MTERSELPYLDTIVEEIVQGRRTLLFPPGTASFVAVNIAFTLGGALLCASLLPRVLGSLVPHAGIAQMLGLVALVPQIVVPGLLVARGRPSGSIAHKYLLSAWCLISGMDVVASLVMGGSSSLVVGLVAACALATARVLLLSPGYLVFSVFQQRLRMRLRRAGKLGRRRGP